MPKAPSPSLREARKHRTRRALREAALRLFASQGYDATTTEEIAEEVGVSARTFFRYFPTKESVLFFRAPAWVDAFAEIYAEQPDGLSDVEAVCATLLQLVPRMEKANRALRLYERALRTSATLRGRVADHVQVFVVSVAEAIADRRGLAEPDEATELLAAVCMLTYQRALDVWLGSKSRTSLADAIAAEFELLAEPFQQAPPKPVSRTQSS